MYYEISFTILIKNWVYCSVICFIKQRIAIIKYILTFKTINFFINLHWQIYNQKSILGSFYSYEVESGWHLLLGLQWWGSAVITVAELITRPSRQGVWLVAQQVDSCTLPLAHAHSPVGSQCKHSDIDLPICHRQWSVWSWLPATDRGRVVPCSAWSNQLHNFRVKTK